MAQTIGTNVVTDEQQILGFIESLLAELEKHQENHGLSKQQANLKKLLAAVGAGENLITNNFYAADAKFIKEILDAKEIPYTILPTQVGDEKLESIIVRARDKEAFYEAQDMAFVQNGRIYQELEVNTVLDNIKTEPVFKNMHTPIFEFKDSKTRGLFTQELAKNDVPYSFDEKSNKIIVYPNQAYKKGRSDLATAIVDMAAKYTVFSRFENYEKFQRTLTHANNEALQNFIKEAKFGSKTNVKLENLDETKGLFFNKDTGCFQYHDRSSVDPIIRNLPVTIDMPESQIYATLSKYAAEVTRKQPCPVLVPDASDTNNLRKGDFEVEDLSESQKVFLMTQGPTVGIGENERENPFYSPEIEKAMQFEKTLKQNLSAVKAEADRYVEQDFKDAKADIKCMKELEFISGSVKSKGIPGFDERITQSVYENLDGSIKNGTGDFGWGFIDSKNIDSFLGRDDDSYDRSIGTERDLDNTLEEENEAAE